MNPKKNRVLIVGPAWIGDMVMAQTLFMLLKQQRPERQLDLIAPAWTLPLVARMPQISYAFPLPIGHGQLQLLQRRAIGIRLRKYGYQQAIVLPNSFKSALIPFFANIPQRTGWRGECRFGVLNDSRKLDKAAYPLMVQRFAALAFASYHPLPAHLPQPQFQVVAENVTQALQNHNLTAPVAPLLALCPGAEFGASKRWPETHYARVANEKLAQGWDVWLFGSAKDRVVTEKINALTQDRCVDLAGSTKLCEAIDLLSLATTVVTNDSGLMHIAAALGRSLVAVYGSTSPQFTPPLTVQAKVISADIACRPCFKRECPVQHHRCMQDLSAETVINAIDEL